MADTELIATVRKLVKAKGRYHTEQNYLAVVAALDMHDAEAKARRSTSSVSKGEMPELPEPEFKAYEYSADAKVWSEDEVRKIIAADRAATKAAAPEGD